MDLAGVYKDLRIDECNNFIGIRTEAAATVMKEACGKWTSHIGVLQKRTERIAALRERLSAHRREEFEQDLEAAAAAEPTVRKILDPPSDFADECYGQLLFRGDLTSTANHIPYLLTVLRFYKIFVTPIMAITMPLMALILPYILVRFVFGIPMPVGAYIGLLRKVYSGGGAEEPTGHLGRLKFYAQTGWLCFNFIQSLWQPIQSAKHLYHLDKTLQAEGEAIQILVGSTHRLRERLLVLGFKSPPLSISVEAVSDVRRAVAYVLESPNSMQLLLRQLGEYEMLYRLAAHPDLCIVRWLDERRPQLRIRRTCDIRIQREDRVPISVNLTEQPHSLLTGPNRGGKSTALRAIGRSVFLAHTLGVGIGERVAMTPFDWIQTCLRLEDIPGQQSLFEREVAFAALGLDRIRTRKGRGLLFIDELFHSTNPPDAEIASRQFLSELWNNRRTLSIISTHLFSLTESPAEKVQLLCCPAIDDGRHIKYKYGLAHGVCKVSSVREILREQGFRGRAQNYR
jgi:hypothetical protein